MHIAILEDDSDQRALLALWVGSGQHTSRGFSMAAEFIGCAKKKRFDLLLLDWMLPDGTGADVLQWVRLNLGWDIPIIVVTARDDEATVVSALKTGADDYVLKPPKPMELLARLDNVARRTKPGGLPVLRLGSFEVDVACHRLTLEGNAITLTQKEFDLSVYLFKIPASCSQETICSTKYGGSIPRLTPAPWTPMSAACARSCYSTAAKAGN